MTPSDVSGCFRDIHRCRRGSLSVGGAGLSQAACRLGRESRQTGSVHASVVRCGPCRSDAHVQLEFSCACDESMRKDLHFAKQLFICIQPVALDGVLGPKNENILNFTKLDSHLQSARVRSGGSSI